ncbi:hypothetical protein LF348_002066 [Klebsiella oxytoca]|uniref:hypothetical protein n=1 Tax=Klebsiella oxytoca TaxID=571 RepID=UPI0018C478C8|nr:hypothetical protein [Klebsiella oxytoca]EKU6744548.1 hypothetical protein [Klebsiella oxytoca]EKU7138316.1 hypothetical protein [Klebsiella oxytoca]EKV0269221.1 hypothetical protein [Klebsiella oxytoca]EKV1583046.1 hypothetical protein [Klebsiella oxytoca]EKV9014076.1 hypothetical protein [Klebsiella oxytoca]
MTSKLTREFMQNIISGHGFGVAPSAVKAMAEYIVAAMDSEPVMFCSEETLAAARDGEHLLRTLSSPSGDCVIPLYRHAQQPVVRPAPECQHQWRHGGANKLQNQKQCIKCGRVELDAQPAPVMPKIDRQAIADKVYGKCCRIPGATFYNAAEFAIDEVEAWQAAMLAAAPQEVPDGK